MDDHHKSRGQLIADLQQLRTERDHRFRLEAIPDQLFRLSPDGILIGYHGAKGTTPMLPPEQFLGRHLLEIFPNTLGLQLQVTLEATTRTGEAQTIEYQLDLDGVPRDYEARCIPTDPGEFLCFVREITNRKRSEEKLLTSQQLLADSQRIAKIGSWRWHPGAESAEWTDALYLIFGYVPCEIVPTPDVCLSHIPPDDHDKVVETLTRAWTTGEPFALEHQIVRRDGSLRVVQCAGQVTADSNRPRAMIGTVQDISERKALEEALQTRNDQLLELDHLKNGFVNSVTHELRTPLTSIMGYAEFLEDEVAGTLNPDQLAFVTQIQRGADRLGSLVDDLLDFARLQSGAFKLLLKQVDLNAKLVETLALLYPQAQDAQVALRIDTPQAPHVLQGDPERIGQILTNLIGNAIKFTPPHGRIDVSIHRERDAARVEVRDTGMGIPAMHQARLFDKFYQIDPRTTRAKGGAGLGLSISKALVEAHGGQIGMTSILGEGSCFWFTLPCLGD